MVKNVQIDSIDSLVELFKQEHNTKINRFRSPYLFRGLSNEKYHLIPSLYRCCKTHSQKLETHALNSFSKYARIEYPTVGSSVWETMMLGQHHGLPTRLLDWTRSPLIALHFADSVSNLDELEKNNCVIWRVDIKELNSFLPTKYQDILNKYDVSVFSSNSLYEAAANLDEYDKDMSGKAFVMVEPPTIDYRIANQFSFFSVVPNGMDELDKYLESYTNNTVKYIISKSIRWDLRDFLDQQNINERMIYPGLDGISSWIARRYYVRV